MKKLVISWALLLPFISGIAQEISYDVNAIYSHPVTKEQLIQAKSLKDINPGYPTSWIATANYISSTVSATSNGKILNSVNRDNKLSIDQSNALSMADTGTEISFEVKYISINSITDQKEVKTIRFSASIVPETEAQYIGGYLKMKEYLKENAIDKIIAANDQPFQFATVKFIINEQGKTTNIRIDRSSENKTTDKLLIDAVSNMPDWRPAKDSNGTRVKQEFEFSVGQNGC